MITDMCETAAQNPDGADVAVAVLVATLGEQEIKDGDMRSTTQDYLKVLTIFNEMVYDPSVADVLRRTPGLKPALERLKDFREGDQGDTTDENIRMLATEVEKHVFQASGQGARATPSMEIIALCPRGHLLSWLDGQGFWHIHRRECVFCNRNLPKSAQRYNCRTCNYYDVCVSCIRWGAPPQRPQSNPSASRTSLDTATMISPRLHGSTF